MRFRHFNDRSKNLDNRRPPKLLTGGNTAKNASGHRLRSCNTSKSTKQIRITSQNTICFRTLRKTHTKLKSETHSCILKRYFIQQKEQSVRRNLQSRRSEVLRLKIGGFRWAELGLRFKGSVHGECILAGSRILKESSAGLVGSNQPQKALQATIILYRCIPGASQ